MEGQETKLLVASSISNTMPSVSFVVSTSRPAKQSSTFAQIYFRCCCRRGWKYSTMHVHQLYLKITATAWHNLMMNVTKKKIDGKGCIEKAV